MPPLDSSAPDPFAAAGLVQGSDGSWSTAAPAAAPAAPAAPQQAGGIQPIYENGQWRGLKQTGDTSAAVNATPADGGTATVTVHPNPQQPASAAPPATPDLDKAMHTLRTAAAIPPPAPAKDPFADAGLVKGSDGSWTAPNVQANNGTPNAPAAAAPTQNNPPAATNSPAGAAPTPAAPAVDPATAAEHPGSPTGAPPVQQEPWYKDLSSKITGATSSLSHGATLGLDEILSPIPAAAVKAMTDGIPFSQAYDHVVQQMRQPRTDFESDHPVAGAALEMAGGLKAAEVFNPLFSKGSAPGASTIAKAGNLVRDTGAGIVAGGVTGATMTDGDLQDRIEGAKSGAAGGAALSLAAPAIGAMAGGASRMLRPFRPTAQAPRLAGNILNEQAAGTNPVFEKSPLPNVSLNIAQASGNPELASLVDSHHAQNIPAMKRELAAQNTGMRDAIGSLQSQDRSSGRASAAASDALQEGSGIIGKEEKRLWNAPSLTKPTISTRETLLRVHDAILDMKRDEPGLAMALEENGPLKRTFQAIPGMPKKMAANQLNAISSRFRRIARDPNLASDVRLVASKLATAAQDGIWNAEQVAGRAAIPANAQTGTRAQPAIAPDPQLVKDLTAARAFTRREAETLGHASFDNILQRNSSGNQKVMPGTAMSRFFDFGSGEEKPGDIKNVSRFLDDIRSEWLKLNNAKDFDPAAVDHVKNELESGARDFIVSKMLDKVSSVERDMTGERKLQFGQVSKWVETNHDMIVRSGLFNNAQLDMWQRIGKTSEMLERGYSLGKGIGSPTYTRLYNGSKYVDVFMHPIVKMGVGATVGGVAGHLIGGEAAWGALLGASGERAHLADTLFDKLYGAPKGVLLKKLDEAIHDPDIAKDLMTRVNPGFRPGPKTRAWAKSVMATLIPGEGARVHSEPAAGGPAPINYERPTPGAGGDGHMASDIPTTAPGPQGAYQIPTPPTNYFKGEHPRGTEPNDYSNSPLADILRGFGIGSAPDTSNPRWKT